MTGPGADPGEVAAAYVDGWKARDFAAVRAVLADDATFAGPLGQANGADELVQGLERLSRIVTDIVVHRRWIDGPDVLTWFDLHTTVAPPAPVANWSRVEDGRITRIRVTFDARPLAPPGS